MPEPATWLVLVLGFLGVAAIGGASPSRLGG
ncbi:MAG: hypothetical protein ACRD1Z_11650 [Vicinamibacteria bacterium]